MCAVGELPLLLLSAHLTEPLIVCTSLWNTEMTDDSKVCQCYVYLCAFNTLFCIMKLQVNHLISKRSHLCFSSKHMSKGEMGVWLHELSVDACVGAASGGCNERCSKGVGTDTQQLMLTVSLWCTLCDVMKWRFFFFVFSFFFLIRTYSCLSFVKAFNSLSFWLFRCLCSICNQGVSMFVVPWMDWIGFVHYNCLPSVIY